MEEEEALPDHLRCNRTDGRQWRCSRRVMENKKLCEIHYIQGHHRQRKQKVPESLKIQRKRKKSLHRDSEMEGSGIRARKAENLAKPMKRRRSVRVSEAVDEAVKKMKLKKGDLKLDLIRMVLKREVEKQKKKRDFVAEESSDSEFTRELPNGLMAISPTGTRSLQNPDNVDSPSTVKIGAESSIVSRRCFRSKNIEPLPIGTLQVVPFTRNVLKLRRGRTKRCHWCRRSGLRSLVECSSCRKKFFCLDCINERYLDTREEVRMACPVCRGTCRCEVCLEIQSKDIECKGSFGEKTNVDRILIFHYLIYMLLPVLKQINQDQSIELEIEAKIKGKEPSEVRIQQAEFGSNKRHCCNNCKTSIVDFHRSCRNCTYNLCLNCCRDLYHGRLPGGIKTILPQHSNRSKELVSGEKKDPGKNLRNTSEKSFGSTYIASPAVSPYWRTSDDNGCISCPPMEFGGCDKSCLDLRCVFAFSWTKSLEISAEEMVCNYEFPETLDISSCCPLCLALGHSANGIEQLQEAARREGSNDNFLYYPAILDIHGDNLEHFQKHWGKGHPVIVRNVLQSASELSWDPVVMFCSYLESGITKSENDKEVCKATNCLDWCEVQIGIRQLFMGSLMGQRHANMCHETLKLKLWLSSQLFQKQFPVHYDEIIHALPLQEYTNPKSGLLNLATKLSQDTPNPDLGPCVYISYSSTEELAQADSVRKLCYDSYDVVNILAHTTDVPISSKQLNKIRKLMKKHKAKDQRDSTRISNDQKMKNKVKGKTSLHDEIMEEAGLQDLIGEKQHLQKRVASGSYFPATAYDACAFSPRDTNVSRNGKHDSVFDIDSEASTFQSSETSEDQKSSEDQIERSNDFGKKMLAQSCGAQWDVFRRQDVPKLIEYLRRHSNEFTHTYDFQKNVVHPILDQSFFLDTIHKMRLKEEFKIEPWTFEQHVGEAVIIPAGCPYQIRNLKSCVNVVLDFVSPENVTECIQLINELRLLPEDHKAKVDHLEVKKLALYSISAALAEIRDLSCERCPLKH